MDKTKLSSKDRTRMAAEREVSLKEAVQCMASDCEIAEIKREIAILRDVTRSAFWHETLGKVSS